MRFESAVQLIPSQCSVVDTSPIGDAAFPPDIQAEFEVPPPEWLPITPVCTNCPASDHDEPFQHSVFLT